MQLRTIINFYFGAAGLNYFPINLFFVPYYALAIIAFFGHVASIHQKKMRNTCLNLNPLKQAYLILAFGIVITVLVLLGLTNFFHGVQTPETYNVLIGK
jgi:hypothetical protein